MKFSLVGFGAAIAALVVLAAPHNAAAQTNLVTNGDFSSTGYGTGSGQISPSPGVQELTGWTIGSRISTPETASLGFVFASGQGDNPNNGAYAYLYGPQNGVSNGLTANSGATTTGGTNGGNFVALDADPTLNGPLYQSIGGLTVGQAYALTFYWATAELDDANTGTTTDSLAVSFGSQTQNTAPLTTVAKGFDPWRMVTMYFTAASTSQTLSFVASGSPAGLPPAVLLDAVSLVAAPEPATWALMLAGVAGLGGFTMLRRRSQATTGLSA